VEQDGKLLKGDDMFNLPIGKYYLYSKPINMQWGEVKLCKICREEMNLNPEDGSVFLFYNKRKDKLRITTLQG